MNIKNGLRSKNRDNMARPDPRRSPIFQRTMAKGMKAGGRSNVGAMFSGWIERILLAKTGDTEEMLRQRKFASAGHRNFAANVAKSGREILWSTCKTFRFRLRPRRNFRAMIETAPRTAPERK